jgi:hypothetical protein
MNKIQLNKGKRRVIKYFNKFKCDKIYKDIILINKYYDNNQLC